MKDVLKYKGFIGSVHFDAEDKTFYGRIEGINDLVTFEGDTVERLEKAFHATVEDYVMLCKKVKKEPLKSCKGSFNVRIPPEIHRRILEKASLLGISLNQFVLNAIEHEVPPISDPHRKRRILSGLHDVGGHQKGCLK